jgi:pseudaminic acid biosynthesis-associated methylase
MTTYQEKIWTGQFGKDYTKRNFMTAKEVDTLEKTRYGLSRSDIYRRFILPYLPKISDILEVGCNIGNSILILKKLGYGKVHGIDIQESAVDMAWERGLNVELGSALNLPYEDSSFDLVFTSGLLIHLHPYNGDLEKGLKEIFRVSKKYIWGFECYSPEFREIENYHGEKSMFWTGNYLEAYLSSNTPLKVVDSQVYDYLDDSGYSDQAFLLEKI